jgi:hypothetical protein
MVFSITALVGMGGFVVGTGLGINWRNTRLAKGKISRAIQILIIKAEYMLL